MEPTTPTNVPVTGQPSAASPSYKSILAEMAAQIKQRKYDLIKRVLLISWPAVLLVVVGKYLDSLGNGAKDALVAYFKGWSSISLILLIVGACLAFSLYAGVMSSILNIEKHLWLDSFFDRKTMSSKESWRVAWKLFWPSVILTVHIFLRYYAIPLLVLIATFAASFYTLATSSNFNPAVSIAVIMAVLIGFSIYFYLLRIKLRYLYFIFIDRYNPTTISYGAIFNELKTLNDASKSESFKKALIVTFGTDTVSGIVSLMTSGLLEAVKLLGGAGQFVSNVIRPLADEAIRQMKSYAQLTANYMLYQQARVIAYNKAQEINEYVYSLRQ